VPRRKSLRYWGLVLTMPVVVLSFFLLCYLMGAERIDY
jgi:hypothetical protein